MGTIARLGRLGVLLGILGAVTVAAAYGLVVYPGSLTELAGIVLAVLVVLSAIPVAARIAGTVFPGYNVAEVAVEGPITRDSGGAGRVPRTTSPGADDIVEQIGRADDDRSVDALLLKLNTPGGAVVPSEDIRQAASDFEGPTIAYTNDMCASGGMWIASGCEELWAREGSIVGSVGVNFAQFRVHEFLERHGIAYEGITAGEYKDSTSPFTPLEEDERAYLQGLTDEYYEQFVQRVADSTGLDPAAIRETEARVYLGTDAHDIGLVDELGDRAVIEDRLEDRLDTPVSVATFEPTRGLRSRIATGANRLAYAMGAGVGASLGLDEGGLQLR